MGRPCTWKASHFFLGDYAGTVGWPSCQLLEMSWYFPRSHVWCLEESEKRAGENPDSNAKLHPEVWKCAHLTKLSSQILIHVGINIKHTSHWSKGLCWVFFPVEIPGPERVAMQSIPPSAPAPAFPFGPCRIWSSAVRRPIAIPWRPARPGG